MPRINAARFIARMDQSKNPDQYARQQLLRTGMLTHANQQRDTMIMVNHSGVAKHVDFCTGILEKEAADGIVSRGYQEKYNAELIEKFSILVATWSYSTSVLYIE